MPGLKTSDILDVALRASLERNCRVDLKKNCDKWIHSIPVKVNDLIETYEKHGFGEFTRDGWAVGYLSGADQTGTFVYYDRTEDEVHHIISNAIPAKEKVPVKGYALVKMVARRIEILKSMIDGIYKNEAQYNTYNSHKQVSGSNLPVIVNHMKLEEILTVKDLRDLVASIAPNNKWFPWEHRKDFDEIQEFVNHPNLDDGIVANGYASVAAALVMKE